MADYVIAARSERAVRCAASRWGLALGIGSPFTILLPLEDRLALECAAKLCGPVSTCCQLRKQDTERCQTCRFAG
jgi:hypothetical protein